MTSSQNIENRSIAQEWIDMHRAERSSPQREALSWAYDLLERLRDSDTERYWLILGDILSIDHSDEAIANLAAGPLEDLLVYHGEAFIDRVEKSSREDIVFKRMLGMVWRNDIPEPIWLRVQRASG